MRHRLGRSTPVSSSIREECEAVFIGSGIRRALPRRRSTKVRRCALTEGGKLNSVLAVDDDPILIEVTSAQLMALDACTIETASSGLEAEQQLSKGGSFDLLILDLNMPNYDGVELLKHLQITDCRSPIIIVSAAGYSSCCRSVGKGLWVEHRGRVGKNGNGSKTRSDPGSSPHLILH